MEQSNNSDATYAACPKCLKVNKISINKAKGHKPTCGSCKAEIDLHGAVLNVDSKQLQKMIASSPLPIVADFWAPWCGPCKSFAPTFEQVANESAGKAVFVKVNTEADASASIAFSVRGIPTLAAFKSGAEIERQSGALPYEYFKPWVGKFARP